LVIKNKGQKLLQVNGGNGNVVLNEIWDPGFILGQKRDIHGTSGEI
jgi:hypothetical protein